MHRLDEEAIADVLDSLRTRGAWMTILDLCEDTGRTNSSVRDVLRTLEVRGLVDVRKGERGKGVRGQTPAVYRALAVAR